MSQKLSRREFCQLSATATLTNWDSEYLLAQPETASHWKQFQYDAANRGYKQGGVSLTQKREDRWTKILEHSQSAIYDETVYMTAGRGARAYDIVSADQKWIRRDVRSHFLPPAVSEDGVFITSNSGRVVRLRRGTGETDWQAQTEFRIHTGPTLTDDVVYVRAEAESGDATLYAFDRDNGNQRWTFSDIEYHGGKYYDDFFNDPWAAPVASPVTVGETVYVGSADQTIYALEASSGEIKWDFSIDEYEFGGIAAGEETVYVGTTSPDGLGSDHRFYALNRHDGSEKWNVNPEQHGAVKQPAAVGRGTVYIPTFQAPGVLLAVDAETGKQQWQFEIGGRDSSFTTGPTVTDSVVYIGSTQGTDVLRTQNGEQLLDLSTGTIQIPVSNETVFLHGYKNVAGTWGGAFKIDVPDEWNVLSGNRESLPIMVTNRLERTLTGLEVTVTSTGDDERLQNFEVTGIGDTIEPSEQISGELRFDVSPRTEGFSQLTVAVQAGDLDPETVGVVLEIERPFRTTARQYGNESALAGGETLIECTVTGNSFERVDNVGVQPRVAELPDEWSVASFDPRDPDPRRRFADAGLWTQSPFPDAEAPLWTIESLGPSVTQQPRLSLAVPDPEDIESESVRLPVDTYVNPMDSSARRRVETTEATLDVERVYVNLDVESPSTPVAENQTGTVSLTTTTRSEPLSDVELELSIPEVVSIENAVPEAAYAQQNKTPTWSWDRQFDPGEQMTASVELGVPEKTEGGSYPVTGQVTAAVVATDDMAQDTQSRSFPITGIVGYKNDKLTVASQIDQFSEGRITESPSVDTVVNKIVSNVTNGKTDPEIGMQAIERLILNEEVARRTLEVIRTVDGDKKEYNFELAFRIADKGLKAVALAILVEIAAYKLKKFIDTKVSRWLGIDIEVPMLRNLIDEVAKKVIDPLIEFFFGSGKTSGITAGVVRSLIEKEILGLPAKIGSGGITLGRELSAALDSALNDVVEVVADELVKIVETGVPSTEYQNLQYLLSVHTGRYNQDPIDSLEGRQSSAKTSASIGKGNIERMGRRASNLLAETNFEPVELLDVVVEAMDPSGHGLDYLIDLYTDLVDAAVSFYIEIVEEGASFFAGDAAGISFGYLSLQGLAVTASETMWAVIEGTYPPDYPEGLYISEV